jgi:hypothetical protein
MSPYTAIFFFFTIAIAYTTSAIYPTPSTLRTRRDVDGDDYDEYEGIEVIEFFN